jgi:hypothetical protein
VAAADCWGDRIPGGLRPRHGHLVRGVLMDRKDVIKLENT